MANATIGNLRVLLTLDSAQFDKAVKSADASTQKLANTMKRDLEPSQTRINKLVRDFAGTKEMGNALNYAQAIEKVGGASKITAQHQEAANRAAMKAIEVYRALGQTVPPEINKLAVATAKWDTATEKAAVTTSKLGGVMGSLKGMAGAFGVTLGASALISFGKSVFDSAANIVDLSAKMGVGVEAAQRFQFAARQAGAEIEDVSIAIVKMNDNLAEGDKSTVKALKDAGLSFEVIRDMKPEDAFRAIADAIGKMPDPMMQTQVAMELFGKSGANILPMIRENALAAADGIQVMSERTVKDLEAAQQVWENFFNSLTVHSANALVGVGFFFERIEQYLKSNRLKSLVQLLGGDFVGFSSGMVSDAAMRDADAQIRREVGAAMPQNGDVQEVGAPAWMGGSVTPKKALTKAQQDKLDKEEEERKKRAIADANKLREAIEKLTGQQLRQDLAEFEKQFGGALKAGGIHKTAVDDTIKTIDKFIGAGLKISPAMMSWYTTAALNDVLGNNEKLQQSFLKTAISASVLESKMRAGSLPVGATPWGALMGGGLSVSDLMGQTNTKGQSLSKLFGGGVMDFTGDMSGKIMRAITGGGDIGKTLGSLFGTDVLGKMTGKMGENGLFDQGIGKMLQGSFLGKKIGGFIGSMIPGLGALLGPAMSAIIGKISGIGKNNTLKDRQGFAQQQGFGDLNAMLDALATSGPGGKALADMAARGIGKGDSDANRKWMADVQKFFEQQAKTTAAVSDQIGKAQQALERFGGSAPKSLRPLIDNLLKSTQLTKEQRTALEAMAQTPSWQTIQQRAEALGIDMGALGGTFNQRRIADAGFGLQHDIEMFLENGADQDGVLRGMADELSALAAEAVKTGRALPKTLEMYVRRLQEMGLLVDEQGNAIADGLMFQDMVDESLQKVVGVLEEIRDLLAGANKPPSVAPTPRIGDWNNGDGKDGSVEPGFRFGDGDGPDFNLPGYAGGTHGAYQDFGAGTPVMLHGRERVMTEAEGRSSSGQMMTLIWESDGRQLSRIVAPYMPGEVRRLGLGRN